MKKIGIKDLRSLTNADVINAELLKRRKISGVSTDSRTVKSDDLFFALKGEMFDAHNYIDDVVKANASVIVVERSWSENNRAYFRSFPCTFVLVDNTTAALGECARAYRRKFDIPVIAVAGSNGKTTTKELIASVLRTKYDVLSTEGNLNNHIGVPQTLFRLKANHDVAVVELGTNHFGELKQLCEIAEPTHGVITNIGREHLEFFIDEAGVAKEETELFAFLEQTEGFAYVNADDPYLTEGSGRVKQSLSYGTGASADIRAANIGIDAKGQPSFDIVWQKKEISFPVKLAVPGMHNVVNALAAASIGLSMKLKPAKIASALERCSSASKRMEVLQNEGITILNDTYNSNPDSVLAALKTLESFKTDGKKILVLGDMRELGEASKWEHTNIGVLAAGMKFDGLYTYGPYSKYTSEAFGETARHFESKIDLSDELDRSLSYGDVVLVKGSRGMKMEDVVLRLIRTNSQMESMDKH